MTRRDKLALLWELFALPVLFLAACYFSVLLLGAVK